LRRLNPTTNVSLGARKKLERFSVAKTVGEQQLPARLGVSLRAKQMFSVTTSANLESG
jgi:hypothetical protein